MTHAETNRSDALERNTTPSQTLRFVKNLPHRHATSAFPRRTAVTAFATASQAKPRDRLLSARRAYSPGSETSHLPSSRRSDRAAVFLDPGSLTLTQFTSLRVGSGESDRASQHLVELGTW